MSSRGPAACAAGPLNSRSDRRNPYQKTTREVGKLKGWQAHTGRALGLVLVACLLAGLTACRGTPGPTGVAGTPSPAAPKMADKAAVQEALTILDQELMSILKTLEDLDLVDEQDLTP